MDAQDAMRSHIRTIVVLALAAGLVALFLHNVDLWGVAVNIVRARPEWLLLSLLTMIVNLALRALRWQYLLEPLGHTTFSSAFRATAVGFAASSILPARAGEVIRPYFLARQARHTAAAGSLAALVVLFVLAGDPARLGRTMTGLAQVLPSTLAGLIARIAEKFARGLGAIRRPGRLLVALAWSFPLWLSIAAGIWCVAVAFRFAVPFTGSFLLIALLVIGVAVPTPGAIGGFHEAFRIGATMFYGAPDEAAVGAAIVLHLFSIGPSLLLGLLFAAQEGLNVGGMRRLADQAEQQGHTA